jgi:hypothetical protein
VAWLEDVARDDRQVARVPVSRRPAARRPAPVRRVPTNGAHRHGAATPTTPTPAPHVSAPLLQVDALRRQQQRILHRSALIGFVLAAERQSGQTLTMGDALAEILADIAEAARTIGTLLQTATEQS